jgi:hypothetical protein
MKDYKRFCGGILMHQVPLPPNWCLGLDEGQSLKVRSGTSHVIRRPKIGRFL